MGRTFEQIVNDGTFDSQELYPAVVGHTPAEVAGTWIAGFIAKAVGRGDLKIVKNVYRITSAYIKRMTPPKPRTAKQLEIARKIMAFRHGPNGMS